MSERVRQRVCVCVCVSVREGKRARVKRPPSVLPPQNSSDLSRRRRKICAPLGQAWLQLPGTRGPYSIPAGRGERQGRGGSLASQDDCTGLNHLRAESSAYSLDRPEELADFSKGRSGGLGICGDGWPIKYCKLYVWGGFPKLNIYSHQN